MKKKLAGILAPILLMIAISTPVLAQTAPVPHTFADTHVVVLQAEQPAGIFLPSDDEEHNTLLASDGDYEYVDDDDGGGFFAGLLFTLVAPFFISLAICLYMKSLNKTAKKQHAAHAYVTKGNVTIHVQEDKFTHQTRSVRKIKKD